MAIKLFLRSKTGATSSIYFRYTKGRELNIILKTPYFINPEQWDEKKESYKSELIKRTPKTVIEKNFNSEIAILNNNLAVLKSEISMFLANSPDAKADEIKDFYNKKYFPEKEKPKTTKTSIPTDLVNFVDYYIKDKSRRIEGKQDPITEATRKKLITIKNRVIIFDKQILLKNVNDDFRDDLTEWMQKEKYSSSTIIKDLKYIKTVCSFASKKKMDVNTEVLHWEFMRAKQNYTPPILSFEELEQIKNTIYPHEYLENAKDWIIVGFYTGARVSDLLNFDAKNIINTNILKFKQKKIENQTHDAEEYIYLHSEVLKVLEKRNGQFPRKISDQRLNEYIKEVCKIAGLTQKMIGGVKDKGQGGRGKKIVKEFEKWELITSHVFRRSFVTNFIEVLGKENIKTQTGHKTDDMVNLYNKTEKIDKAMRIAEKNGNSFKNSLTHGTKNLKFHIMKYNDFDQLKDQLNHLRQNHSDKVAKAFDIEYTYESNKIEGNTLTLQETALVIEKGLTIGGKSLNEHLEAINHQHAIEFIKELASEKQTISERDLLQIHQLILQGIDNQHAGKYRNVQVLISGAKHIPPQPFLVPKQMEDLFIWYNDNKDLLHPVELSAEMHERLVTIHPFIDGNGRTSRLLMNLILLQNGFPIAILKGDTDSRLKYYGALETAQTENNKQPFLDLIEENVRETMERIINVTEN